MNFIFIKKILKMKKKNSKKLKIFILKILDFSWLFVSFSLACSEFIEWSSLEIKNVRLV